MANYSISSLKEAIRIVLDQNASDTQLGLGDIDTLSINEIIESKIADAVRITELAAPHHMLDGGVVFPNSSQVITWKGQPGYGPGTVPLPTDFLRLVCFQMTGWEKPAYEAITAADPRYAMQMSRFAGIRGNASKPIVAIVTKSSNTGVAQYLEFYSGNGDPNASVAMASYIALPEIVNSQIDICPKLKSAVIYKAAAMTAQTISNNEQSAALENTFATLIQG